MRLRQSSGDLAAPQPILNQGQGGIYMVGWLEDGLNSRGERVGLGLENSATAAFDFVGPVGQPWKKAPTFSRTLALVPKQVLAVTSARTQPQMCSSGLKSGL